MIKLKNLLPECEDCGRDWNHGQDHEGSMAEVNLKMLFQTHLRFKI